MNNDSIKIALKRTSEGIFYAPYDKERFINVLNTQLAEADLSGMSLHDIVVHSKADFRKTNLSEAMIWKCDFEHSIFTGANFESCYAEDTFFYCCDLSSVNFANIIFKNVSFLRCNLKGSDFSKAILVNVKFDDSNLSGTKFDYTGDTTRNPYFLNVSLDGCAVDDDSNLHKIYPIWCPTEGSFIGWKLAFGDNIVKLEIPSDARRSSGTSRRCRCDKARVLSIFSPEDEERGRFSRNYVEGKLDRVASKFDRHFFYEVGKMVYADKFGENRWTDCTSGIHFVMTFEEAKKIAI